MKRLFSVFKFLLKSVAVLSLCLVLLLMITASWLFHNPEQVWSWASARFLPKDLQVQWSEFQLQPEYLGGLNFQLSSKIKNLQVQMASTGLDVVVSEFDLKMDVLPWHQPWFEIDHLRGDLEKLILPTSKEVVQEPQQESNPFELLQNLLAKFSTWKDRVEWRSLDLQAKEIKPTSSGPWRAQARIWNEANSATPNRLLSEARLEFENKKLPLIQAQALLDPALVGGKDVSLQILVKANSDTLQTEQKLKLILNHEQIQIDGAGPLSLKMGKQSLSGQPEYKLLLDESEAVLKAGLAFKGLDTPVVRMHKLAAEVAIPFEKSVLLSEKPARFDLRTPLELYFLDKNLRPPLEKSCQCRLPEVLEARLRGEFWPRVLMANPSQPTRALDVNVQIESVKNKLLSLDLAGDLTLRKHRADWLMDPRLNSILIIHHFMGLKNFLQAKGVLIPAPFDVLDGTLEVRAATLEPDFQKGTTLGLQTKVRLRSATQVANLSGLNTLRFSPRMDEVWVSSQNVIEDLVLELPPMDPLAGLPKVFPDKRILRVADRGPDFQKKKRSQFKIHFVGSVETARAGAVRLLTSYAEPAIPLTLKVQYAPPLPLQGFVRAEPFKLSYLKRDLLVDQLQMNLQPVAPGVFPIDGKMRVEQTTAVVFVALGGTSRNPQVDLTSEPYLPRNEIISVLLYDRTSDQLVSTDAKTAGGVDAAMADRAIGLLGLWAFAATPIRSFSYNPVNKTYTATVQIGDGLTAGVGSDFEDATRFEIQKRVSNRWTLLATWAPPTEKENQKDSREGSLKLQWENRF